MSKNKFDNLKKRFGQKVLGKRILQLFKLKILEKRVLWPFSRVFFKNVAGFFFSNRHPGRDGGQRI